MAADVCQDIGCDVRSQIDCTAGVFISASLIDSMLSVCLSVCLSVYVSVGICMSVYCVV